MKKINLEEASLIIGGVTGAECYFGALASLISPVGFLWFHLSGTSYACWNS